MSYTILVVEDDQDMANLISLNLKVQGYKTILTSHISEGYQIACQGLADAVILDRKLCDGDGTEMCKLLRQQHIGIPVLMLTALTSEHDMVDGLEAGADDYLTKPFSVIELQARVRALLRRTEHTRWTETNDSQPDIAPPQTTPDWHLANQSTHQLAPEQIDTSVPSSLIFDDLVISKKLHEVRLAGENINLTPTEFSLLYCLASKPGRVFTKDELLIRVWNTDYDGYHHTVCSTINRLRNKIEIPKNNARFIRTVWGVGYKFQQEVRQ
ncbi:response regulator transcription factor [Vibrio penaeicida]|uniref:response regulator transcription factor n=1 Tax=Vibrio penaeicida TaxID=104609 RepID=UPI002732D303|nr:response regulator transcription factor [Vibrio penaeicida]MDP2572944.1 response regulator transcription factor [Vibrio penaeicida]